jgi:hypothetical protein
MFPRTLRPIAALAVAVAVPASAGAAYGASSASPVAHPKTSSSAPVAVKAATPVATYPYEGVTDAQLKPNGIEGAQSYIPISASMMANARTVVQVASQRGMPAYAAVIAVATAIQESKLYDYTNAVDHDSLGIFQQRPSCGWGTADQIENVSYAANAFLAALPSGYMGMALTDAAQTTQGSADPYAYAQWQNEAATIVMNVSHGG